MYYLTVRETKDQDQGVGRIGSCRGLWGRGFDASPSFWPFAGNCGCSLACKSITLISAFSFRWCSPRVHVCLCIQMSFLEGHQSQRIRVHSNNLILTLSSKKTLFPNKITFTGIGGLGLQYLVGGNAVQPITRTFPHPSMYKESETEKLGHLPRITKASEKLDKG